MVENDFTRKYRAKLANAKADHETRASLRKYGMGSHDKALTKMAGKGNVLKGKNIEGGFDERAHHSAMRRAKARRTPHSKSFERAAHEERKESKQK